METQLTESDVKRIIHETLLNYGTSNFKVKPNGDVIVKTLNFVGNPSSVTAGGSLQDGVNTVSKVIYCDNTNDLRINAPKNTSIVSLDTVGSQRVLVGVFKSGLSNGSANSIFSAAIGDDAWGGGVIDWKIEVTDGTDFQARTGITTWCVASKAGVITTDVDEIGGSVAVSSGTLTGTWSVTTGTNLITLKLTSTSSLTPTSHVVRLNIKNHGGTITRL